jgi:hypothetical protein
MKFGIYTAYPVSLFTNQTLRVFHRGVVVGNETCSFADMFPESSSTVYPINPTIHSTTISQVV